MTKPGGMNYARIGMIGMCTGVALLLLLTDVCIHFQRHLHIVQSPAHRHPPSLYVADYGRSPDKRWYVVSAFMDTRPLAFRQPGAITLVASGPHDEVRKGKPWFAIILALYEHDNSIRSEIARIDCGPTQFLPHDSHPDFTTHIAATIVCSDASAWNALKRMPHAKLGVCLMDDATSTSGCGVRNSIVPVTLPYNYPHFPTTWGAELSTDSIASTPSSGIAKSKPARRAVARMEASLKGEGDIAMCISPVAGGLYTSTLPFFMKHYGEMGVSHIFMYMRRPPKPFVDLVEGIVDEQRTARVQGIVPSLELLPWCLQQDATYGCVPGQHKIEPGFWKVASASFGQILQIQDCFMRSIGRYRWTLMVDLDEYAVPHAPYIKNLHDLVANNLLREPTGKLIAPSELRFRSAFFEPCLPGDADRAHMSQQAQHALFSRDPESYPRPIWAAARISEVLGPNTRSKYMCDTLTGDRVGIHFMYTTLCERFKTESLWPAACTSAPKYVLPIEHILLHHARRKFAADQVVHKCTEHPKKNATDWTFANVWFGQRIRRQFRRSEPSSQTWS